MNAPTLLLGEEPRVVIPVARSLWRHGVPVIVASFRPEYRLPRSRAVTRRFHLTPPEEGEGQTLASLRDLIRGERIDWVVPCSDSTLSFVAAHYEELKNNVRFSCPRPEAVVSVLNKQQTLKAAAECGISVPHSFRFDSAEQMQGALNSLPFPLIAKPISKQVDAQFKLRFYRDSSQLMLGYTADPGFASKYLLQEYVPGEGVGIEVLLDRGEPVLLFQHRRLKEYPVAGGVSVLAVAEPLDQMLVDWSLALLRRLEWEGVAMVEYRQDRATQKAVLMEVNGRYWGSLALSAKAGLDFPFSHWQTAHGVGVATRPKYRIGARARWSEGLLLRLEALAGRQSPDRPPPTSFWRELLTCWLDFRPGTGDMLWSWRDPGPAIESMADVLSHIAKRHLKDLLRRVLPATLSDRLKTYRSLEQPAARVYARRQLARILGAASRCLPHGVNSVLFVCHGNIIRSAVAEAAFKKLSSLPTSSAGVCAEAGRPADPRIRDIATEFGLSLQHHLAQPLTAALVEGADLILVMDAINEARLLSRFPGAGSKTRFLGTFSPQRLRGHEIPDPYPGSKDDVRHCCELVAGCVAILKQALDGRR